MSYEVIYANTPLHNYVDIQGITRTILPSRVNSSRTISNMNGSYYTGYRYGEKEITLNCSIVAEDSVELEEKMKNLAYILDVQVPHKMILSDAPDRYVWAVIDGTTEITKSFGKIAQFDLKFICYDPYEYSKVLKNTAFTPSALEEDDEDEDLNDEIVDGEGDDDEIDYEDGDFMYEDEDEEDVIESGDDNINLLNTRTSDELALAKKQYLHFENEGGTSTYPILKAQFYDTANFFQCTDTYGRAVLVGTPPNLDIPTKPPAPVVLNDKCTTLEGWNAVGNVLDGDVVRTIDGSLTINKNGYAITCSNYGNSGDGVVWHGGAGRKNLSREVTDFKVEVEMEHASGGTLNKISETPSDSSSSDGSSSNTSNYYIITAKTSVNIRKSRSSSSKVIGTIPNGKKVKVTSIKNKWGKVVYNKKTGYINMSYTKLSTKNNSSGTSNKYNKTKYKTKSKITIRKSRGSKYKSVGTIPKYKTVYVSSIKNGWGYVSYNKKKGYIHLKNLTKLSSKTMLFKDEQQENVETKEDRMGRIELYGFDKNGQKLFKILMRDSSSYYEYSEPEIWIGSTLELSDGKSVPKAKTITYKEDGKQVTKKVDGGSYGDWNEFNGKFTVERRTKNKKQYWNIKVEKMSDSGIVTKEIGYTNLQDNTKYPTGALANIVIWFGKYKDEIPVDTQNICSIKVTDVETTPPVIANEPIFKEGDELVVDFEEQGVYLNGVNALDQLDIGSEFFSLPAGYSQVTCRTDTEKMTVFGEYRERWL